MRQLLYVSDSLIGDDDRLLDQLMVQAQANNAIDGITGLLWTDGRQFAQVLEGGEAAIDAMLPKLLADTRHTRFRIVEDRIVDAREFGQWSMARPADDLLAETYEQRMVRQLTRTTSPLGAAFTQVISGSRRSGIK